MKKIMCLCEGRHPIPEAIDGAIFPSIVNPLDIKGMDSKVADTLEGVTELTLYVTGLTVALVAVINYCYIHHVKLVLMHYDRDSASYYPQKIG